MRFIPYIFVCIALFGCASVTRGVNEDVVIRYTPEDAIVTTSLNHSCQQSPCTVQVSRKQPFTVRAQKPGYITQVVDVQTKVAGAGAAGFAGNVIIGGVVGMGVDAATGATLDHVPNPVIINLVPESATPAAVPGTLPGQGTDTVPVS